MGLFGLLGGIMCISLCAVRRSLLHTKFRALITSSHTEAFFSVTAISARRLPDLSLQPSDAEDTKAATQKSGCAAVSAP